jgi:NAD(P)-dependent dehydrogenase (short-subunit alcohol dehydrogenase family)
MDTLIVTGASRGIGAAVARLASDRGYAVAVNYSRDREGAETVVRELARGIAIQADVGDDVQVRHLFETAERELGPIRALVNNAAITGGFARVDSIDAATLSEVLRINVTGTALCSREAVCRMSTRLGGSGGAIVNISSLVARTGGAGEWVHYAASKGAVNSFTIGLAREVAHEGIRVNAVAPGLIDTSLHAAAGAPDRVARMAPAIPMGRGGSPDEVAEAVVWLLSNAASYVTGAILDTGGGR